MENRCFPSDMETQSEQKLGKPHLVMAGGTFYKYIHI